MAAETTLTRLLAEHAQGHPAAWDQIIPILYEDLRRVARQRLRFDRRSHTLSTTALVHECYLRLLDNRQLTAADRDQFLAAASQTMRRVIVDYARHKKRQKRGGGQEAVPFDETAHWLDEREIEEVLSIDTALDRLAALDERAARVIELRFFGGLSLEETAQVLGVSGKTAQRAWVAARAWLRKEIDGTLGTDPERV